MYGNQVCSIERLDNGYVVKMRDPKIVAANKKRENKDQGTTSITPWRDPERSFACVDITAVLDFLKNNLDKATVEDDYSTSFKAAALAESDEE